MGFPQYGFKREVHGDLRQRTKHTLAYTPRKCDPQTLIAIAGILSGSSVTAPPVQRPLAHQRVMLSRRVIAYYGLIRDSGLLPPTYALYGRSLWPHYFPRETRGSPIYFARLYPRAALRTPVDCAIAPDCYFIAHTSLRHFRTGSAPTLSTKSGSLWRVNEAASFALCYGPSGLLAPPRPGLLLSSFHPRGSLLGDVEYNYMGLQSIPMTGLSPARHAALWAANETTRSNTKL